MSTKLKVEWFEQKNLNEIYQQVRMQFAFLSAPKNGSKQCHSWAYCRDFLHDAVRTQAVGSPTSIYGFDFKKGTNPPIDLVRTRMLVRQDGLVTKDIPKFEKKMKASLKLLNHYEKMAGVSLSKVQKVDDKKLNVWAFNSPGMWIKIPQLVSMYSMLIRLGDKEFKFKDNEELRVALKKQAESKANDNDTRYLKNCWNKLDLIIKNRNSLFPKDGYETYKSMPTSSFHNNSGIYTLCSFTPSLTELKGKLKKIITKEETKK